MPAIGVCVCVPGVVWALHVRTCACLFLYVYMCMCVFVTRPLVLQVANLQNGICTASPMNSINALQLTLPSSSGQGEEEVANGTDTSSTMGGATPTLDDIPGSCNAEGAQTQTIVSV